MLARVVQQAHHVMVVEGVKREASHAADPNEPRGPQQAKLMGDGRLGHAHEVSQISDAALAMRQGVDQAHTRRVDKQPENVGDGANDGFGKQGGAQFLDDSRCGGDVVFEYGNHSHMNI